MRIPHPGATAVPQKPLHGLQQRKIPMTAVLDKTNTNAKQVVSRLLSKAKAEGRDSLTAPEAKELCDVYGIPVPQEGLAKTADEAVKLSEGMGFPVVLKIVSPQILHKTEAGGVLVGVKSAEEARNGFQKIIDNAKAYDAKADIHGIQVQQMLK